MSVVESTAPPPAGTAEQPSPVAASREQQLPLLPHWVREIDSLLPVNPQFVVAGNIRDVHLAGPREAPTRVATLEALWRGLQLSGYTGMLVHDPVDGIQPYPAEDQQATAAITEVIGGRPAREISLPALLPLVRNVVEDRRHRLAVVLDYASRLPADPARLSDEERIFYVGCEKLSHRARPLFLPSTRSAPVYNPIIWLVQSDRDIPSWLLAGNEAIRLVSIPLPDLGDRLALATRLVPSLVGGKEAEPALQQRVAQRFAEQTESMTLRSLTEITQLAIDRRLDVADVEDAVRSYRVGMLDNPWKRAYLRERIRSGHTELSRRVKGQDRAIERSLDILTRSAMGLTGAHASAHAGRPRGILFFTGPTGVGKTELAKAMTQLVFGDERAYTRFDMSEFSSEHSDARLIGSPPGYVGHDAGGELTNAARQRPFSLILFDEIEKAHPRILDKFLQILEDGRLSDGTGSTVHFSEALLVFTSNLGIYVDDEAGNRRLNVEPGTPRPELESRIQAAISDHFQRKLNRPELLNRIGDNIVVFDFISDPVAHELVDLFLTNIVARVEKEQRLRLSISDAALAELHRLATADPSFGGRGIGSRLESVFVNPLSRALFVAEHPPGDAVEVLQVQPRGETWEVVLR